MTHRNDRLCNAILEEMVKLRGAVNISGNIGYVPQSPFTLNNTLRENILFGAEWNLDKYGSNHDVAQKGGGRGW